MSIKSVSAYPLTWPEGWPRLPGGRRTRAKFGRGERQYSQTTPGHSWVYKKQLSVNDSIQRVLKELERLGVRYGNAIISTNLPVRMDGLPRSDAKVPQDPGVAVYWETDGKPMQVMAVDRYDRVADNLAAIAATLEAMRAIERHGGAQILERAFTGFQALPSPDNPRGRTWHDALEFKPGSVVTLDDCEKQYRLLRSKYHPDKLGGNPEKFRLVQWAIEQARRELR